MNILEDLKSICDALKVPVETGAFTSKAPDTYIVLVPLNDSFPLSGDDYPLTDEQAVRISLFSKKNYISLKNKLTTRLLGESFYITDRRYNGYEAGTGYHQYTIDVAKLYDLQEEI